jgi:sec-independent protein translocase protein TatA
MTLLGIIGGQEILIILLIVLVLFGGKKIPELMKGLGKGVKEYKNAVNNVEDEVKSATSNDEAKKDDKA